MKKSKLLFVLLASLSLVTACTPTNVDTGVIDDGGDGQGEADKDVAVSSVMFETTSFELEEGEVEYIEHTVLPVNATNKNVSFKSSNTSVATVAKNSRGEAMVHALSPGICYLTVITEDGDKMATCTLTVTAKAHDGEQDEPEPDPLVSVTGVSVTPSSMTMKVGDQQATSVTITPANASNKNVSYSSSDSSIAYVSSSGIIGARKAGNATITVTTLDGGYTATISVTVENKEQQQEEEPEELPAINYVQVFAPKSFETIYAWKKEGEKTTELTGAWPGTSLNSYNDKWKTYEFRDYTSVNVIFSNNGQNKTGDLTISKAGYYWYDDGKLVTSEPIPFDISDIPQGNYEIVDSASDYSELPAVKYYSKGNVVNKYTGSRDDFRDESIYFTITTRFYDGDKSNNAKCWGGPHNDAATDPEWRGDFKGLIERMDYIKALGFTAIWITPVVKNASGLDYHGYHAINFKEVDPRYLSQDVSFQTVINEAHSRDMKIILDVVFNHTGNFGEENLFPMFNYDSANDTTINGITRNEESHLLSATYDDITNPEQQYDARLASMKGERDVYNIYHHSKDMSYESYSEQTGQMAGDCVDLNTENPTVANYIVDAYGEFIRMGVDGFRIDTMKHISRLTFNKYIWPGLHEIARKCGNTNFFMFGEVCARVRDVWNKGQAVDSCPFYTWKESKDYSWGTREKNEIATEALWYDNITTMNQPTSSNAFLNGLNYHTPDHSRSSGCSVIDFSMHWNFENAWSAYNIALQEDQYFNDSTYNVVYVDSHDYGPDGAEKIRYNAGTDAWKENMNLMFTFRGVPCIYYGSEVEFQKGKEIDKGELIALEDSGRAYFGDYLEGTIHATGFGEYTASGTIKSTLEYTLAQHLIKLNKIRLQVPALRRGQYTTSNTSGGMAYTRRYTDRSKNIDSIACVTVSNGATFYNLPSGTYKEMMSGQTVTVGSNGNLNATIRDSDAHIAIYVKQ